MMESMPVEKRAMNYRVPVGATFVECELPDEVLALLRLLREQGGRKVGDEAP
jgi:hypothetical protein